MTYNFTVQNVGTYWWHAHYSTQVRPTCLQTLFLRSPRVNRRGPELENRRPLRRHGSPLAQRTRFDDRTVRRRGRRVTQRLVQYFVRHLETYFLLS